LRQPPAAFQVGGWMGGRGYRELKAQLRRFEALGGVRWIGGSSAVGLFESAGIAGHSVLLASATGTRSVVARRVLVAAGCYDMPVPLPGWTKPGVMTAGGVQTLLKGQQLLAGRRSVLAGTHPLMLVVADQIRRAEGEVVAVLFAQPVSAMLARIFAHPLVLLRHLTELAEAARCFLSLRRAGVAVHFRSNLIRVEGEGAAEAAVCTIGGYETDLPCDLVALNYGFLPQSDLCRLAGARVRWAFPAGGWAAEHDDWMRSSVPGLYVAGETVGVRGAATALETGRIAAAAMLLDEGRMTEQEARRCVLPARRRLRKLEGFSRLLADIADPSHHLPTPDSSTLICRCEDVSVADIESALAQRPEPLTPNSVKLACRAGMGLCQGRGCEHSLLRMMSPGGGAPLLSGNGAFTVRFPIRPVAIKDLVDG
jgi:D-hydroxyproline dehydrogenase subunit alpha